MELSVEANWELVNYASFTDIVFMLIVYFTLGSGVNRNIVVPENVLDWIVN